jgi:integrase
VQDGTVCDELKLHNFRKTYATKLHQLGVSLDDPMLWLGHKDLKTTQLYLAGSENHDKHVRAPAIAAFSFYYRHRAGPPEPFWGVLLTFR